MYFFYIETKYNTITVSFIHHVHQRSQEWFEFSLIELLVRHIGPIYISQNLIRFCFCFLFSPSLSSQRSSVHTTQQQVSLSFLSISPLNFFYHFNPQWIHILNLLFYWWNHYCFISSSIHYLFRLCYIIIYIIFCYCFYWNDNGCILCSIQLTMIKKSLVMISWSDGILYWFNI